MMPRKSQKVLTISIEPHEGRVEDLDDSHFLPAMDHVKDMISRGATAGRVNIIAKGEAPGVEVVWGIEIQGPIMRDVTRAARDISKGFEG